LAHISYSRPKTGGSSTKSNLNIDPQFNDLMCKLYEKVIELMEGNGRRRLGPENILKLYQHLALRRMTLLWLLKESPKELRDFSIVPSIFILIRF